MSFPTVTKGRKINRLDIIPKSAQEIFWEEIGREGWYFSKTGYPDDSGNTTKFSIPFGEVGRKIMANLNISFIPLSLLDGPVFKQLLVESTTKRSSPLWKQIITLCFGAHSIFMTIWGYPKRQHWEVFGLGMIDSVCKYLLCQDFSLSIDGKWCIIN